MLYKQNVIYAGIQIMPLSLTDKFLGCMIYDLSILFLYISLNKFNDTVLYVLADFTSTEYRVWKYILWTFVIGIRKKRNHQNVKNLKKRNHQNPKNPKIRNHYTDLQNKTVCYSKNLSR